MSKSPASIILVDYAGLHGHTFNSESRRHGKEDAPPPRPAAAAAGCLERPSAASCLRQRMSLRSVRLFSGPAERLVSVQAQLCLRRR
mmetsp:Transcript_41250/g.90561  ORF Transcript_41250/g.90561 Transcript_41250/m.90561 type:complete len:87 (+) Transcript_41250:115-375(+)